MLFILWNVVLALRILGVALALTTAAHAGEQTRFYDSRGNSIGTATRNSEGTTVFRDSRGNVTGRAYSPSRR